MLLHGAGVFSPGGRWLYDHASQKAYDWHWSNQASVKGIYNKRPVLIAVDEASLRTLGRWPWPRRVHAELLNTLTINPAQPSALAWDVVFAEPHIPELKSALTLNAQGTINDDDALFASAINRSKFPIILATQFEQTTTMAVQRAGSEQNQTQSLRLVTPRAPLNTSAARIAHIHIDADVDGSVRRFLSVDTRLGGVTLPYLGRALWQPQLAYPIKQLLLPPGANAHGNRRILDGGDLLYPMPDDWVKQVSYQDVLSGAAPASYFAGVPVLVAATAKGLGDQYVSHLYQPSSVVAGGELVLGAMHTERLHAAGLPQLRMAHQGWESLVAFVLMLAVLLGLRRCQRIFTQLGVLMLGLTAVAVLSLAALAYLGVWLNAALLGVGIVISWMLWMSYVLQRFVAHIQSRLAQLGHSTVSYSHPTNTESPSQALNKSSADVMGGQLSAVTALEQRQQAEFMRLNQVLDLLPDAAFVLNDGEALTVYQHNLAARQLCLRHPAARAATDAAQTTLNHLLADFLPDLTPVQHSSLLELNGLGTAKTQTMFHWQDLLTHHGEVAFAQGVEANSARGERFLIKVAQLLETVETQEKTKSQATPTNGFNLPADLLGEKADNTAKAAQRYLVVSIIDLSVGLTLAQSRERTLNFLSHDIRAPQANIVALLELEKSAHPELAGLFSKVQFQAQRTLHLAEGFVQWSQASHRPAYQFIEYNLNELMIDALDEQWASAKQKGVHLTGFSGDQALWVMVDRSLMWRALVNLISNALNACVSGQETRLSTRQSGQYAVITVQDNGPGIPHALHAHLFEPFVQGLGLKRTGAGLGLAFVKTVIDQHQGQLKLHSPVFSSPQPHGTLFELWLPLAPDVAAHDEDSEP